MIDEAARPDLVSQLVEGRLARARCRECARVVYSIEPVVLIRGIAGRDVALSFSDAPDDEPPRELDTPTGRLALFPLSFEAISVVLSRNLNDDAEHLDTAVDEVSRQHGPRAAERYRLLVLNILHGDELELAAEVLGRMTSIDEEDEFATLLHEQPWLLEQRTVDAVECTASIIPPQAAGLGALATLLRDARDDLSAAWAAHSSYEERAERALEELGPIIDELEALVADRRFDDAIARGTHEIETAEEAGAPLVAGVMDRIVADALLRTESGDHAENVELALHHYMRAVERASDDEDSAERLAALAIAYGMRVLGDPRENLEESVRAMRVSVRLLEQQGDSDLLALVQTNLAQSLERRESGERLANLDEAYALCRAALRWRSPERDAVDWAYSMVNLGHIVEKRADAGSGGAREARKAYEAVIGQADRVVDRRVLGLAYSNLGNVHRVKAVKSRLRCSRERHLARAEAALEQALVCLDGVDRLFYGRAVSNLADIHELRGDDEAALAAAQRAAEVLRPTLALDEAHRASTRVGAMRAERGDWHGAAAAFAEALAAADLRYHSRVLAADRAAELEDRGNLNRWAAFALAQDGQLEAAALALENGRMRELRRRLPPAEGELERLEAASPDLHRDLVAATADLAHAELADDSDEAARRHHAVLERIRSLPGLEGFAGSVDRATVAASAELGRPTVYVNPTPRGTLVLVVSRDGADGDARLDATFLDVTSTEIVERLLFGLEGGQQVGPPYALAVMAQDQAAVSAALAFNLPWFGRHLAAGIDATLSRIGADGATIVLAGPLALLPLHAAPWAEDGVSVILGDRYAISAAPSAAAHAAALKAASRQHDAEVLVAIGDPRGRTDALPSARAEVEYIAARFAPENRIVAIGSGATSRFLLEHAHKAKYLHLACHARGLAFDFRQSSVQLADADLALTRLAGMGGLHARLAVISACQTGVADVTSATEEAYSIGAVLLAAGAACAIVSLWPVDDYATALLMTRLYEILDQEPRPVFALQRAQLWLRTLTDEAHAAYVAARPSLAIELKRRRGAALPPQSRSPYGNGLPFADPVLWAGFVAMGA